LSIRKRFHIDFRLPLRNFKNTSYLPTFVMGFGWAIPDTRGTMRHDQWGLQINKAWVEERLKTPFKWGKR
jgi:hypothetical protein